MKGEDTMHKKAKHASPIIRIAALMISLLLMISIVPLASAAETPGSPSASKYGITEKITYDVTIGSEEWDSMDIEQKRDIFRIPEEIYANMSTEAFLLTVLENPFTIELLVFSSPSAGLQVFESDFPEMTALLAREDLLDTVTRCLSSFQQVHSENNTYQETVEDLRIWLSGKVLEYLVDYCSKIEPQRYYVEPETGLHWEYVQTPNNSNVKAYIDFTYADHGISYEYAYEATLWCAWSFSATILSQCDPEYNCHSYAWHLANTSNSHWINNPSKYMTDGSYSAISAPSDGCKVYYNNGNLADNHSGIISYESGTYYVISKWGPYGLLKSTLTNSLYYHAGTTVFQYWS